MNGVVDKNKKPHTCNCDLLSHAINNWKATMASYRRRICNVSRLCFSSKILFFRPYFLPTLYTQVRTVSKAARMPITKYFTLPSSVKELALSPDSKLFIAFISSSDPITKQPWCPDVRDALPHINKAFAGDDAPELAIIEVGQKPE